MFLSETNPSRHFLTSNCCIQLKYKSSIHNIALFGEKVISSESGEKYAQIKHHLHADYRLLFGLKAMVEIENALMMYLFVTNTQLFTSHDVNWWLEWCGLLVDYCDVLISCLDAHSDGTHSLQRIHCWANDVMLHFSKSVPINKQMKLDHVGWPVSESILSTFSVLDELYL